MVNEYAKPQLPKPSFCVAQALCGPVVGTAQAATLPLRGRGCQHLNSLRGTCRQMGYKTTLSGAHILTELKFVRLPSCFSREKLVIFPV